MTQAPQERSFNFGAIDAREIALTVLKGWKIVGACVALFVVWTLYVLHVSPTIYAAQMQVTPVQGAGDQGASRANSLTSLAALAGMNPSANQSASQFRLYVESLRSRDVAEDLAKDQGLMRAIFGREWDEDSQSWQEPEHSLVSTVMSAIWGVLGFPQRPWEAPNGARLQRFLAETVNIIQDQKKPYLVTVTFNSPNPSFAIRILNAVNQAADDHLRKKALLRATQYIDYLTKALNTVTVAEHREAIMQALSEQEKFAMSASSAAPYAADLFDKPWASLEPISPKPRQAYILAVLKGGLLGAAIVLALRYLGAFAREQIRYRIRVERLPQFVRRPLRL